MLIIMITILHVYVVWFTKLTLFLLPPIFLHFPNSTSTLHFFHYPTICSPSFHLSCFLLPPLGVYVEKVGDSSGEGPYVGLLGIGDEILQVNGEAVAGLSLDQVTRLMTRESIASLRIMPARRNQRWLGRQAWHTAISPVAMDYNWPLQTLLMDYKVWYMRDSQCIFQSSFISQNGTCDNRVRGSFHINANLNNMTLQGTLD